MHKLIQTLKDRSINSESSISKNYLACLCGMWAETLGDKEAPKFDNQILCRYSIVGFDASRQFGDKKKKVRQKKNHKLGIISRFS